MIKGAAHLLAYLSTSDLLWPIAVLFLMGGAWIVDRTGNYLFALVSVCGLAILFLDRAQAAQRGGK